MLAVSLTDISREVKSGLSAMYGARLCDVVMYGSRARGDARDDSDIDYLVVLADDEVRVGRELLRCESLLNEISREHDVLVSAHFVAAREWNAGSRSMFLANVRDDGVVL